MNTEKMRIVVTGTGWLGGGFGSIETSLESLLQTACEEILIVTYSITAGAEYFFERLEEALDRGVTVTVLINRYQNHPRKIRNLLEGLAREYPYFKLYDFCPPESDGDLHAKLVVIDRIRALIGSSNLSRRGLIKNHEMAVLVEDRVAGDIASAVYKLLNTVRYVKRIQFDHI